MSEPITADAAARHLLAAIGRQIGMIDDLDPGLLEQNASGTRDLLIRANLDPSDPTVLETGFVCSLQALFYMLCNGLVVSFGPGMQIAWIQTEIFRRWIDKELPVMSVADMLGLHDLDGP